MLPSLDSQVCCRSRSSSFSSAIFRISSDTAEPGSPSEPALLSGAEFWNCSRVHVGVLTHRSRGAGLQRPRRAAFAPDSKTASSLFFPRLLRVSLPLLCVKSFPRKSLCQTACRSGHPLPGPQSAHGHFPLFGSKGESIKAECSSFNGGASSLQSVCAALSLTTGVLIANQASSADVSFKWDIAADSRR